MSTRLILILSCFIGTALSLEVGHMQYHFWFRDKIHKNWILNTYEDNRMLACAVKCQSNADCIGLALGSLGEDLKNHVRRCYLLSSIDEEDCNHDYDCAVEGVQVYAKAKPLTSTTEEVPSSTKASTSTEAATTSPVPKKSTTTSTTTTSSTEHPKTTSQEITTTTQVQTTTSTQSTSTTETESPTSTQEPTTKRDSTTTITQEPMTSTIKEQTTSATTETTTTTTTEESTTVISTVATTTTTTTEEPTTVSSTEEPTTVSSTKEPTTVTSTEKPTTVTSTEEPTTVTSTKKPTTVTSTKEPTTSTTTTTPLDTTTTEETTTTEKTTTTTTDAPTTSTEVPTTTTTEESTTTLPTTTETTTTVTTTTQATTTEEQTTTSEPEQYEKKCYSPTTNISCDEPREQMVVIGLRSNFPLFSDADLNVICENFNYKPIFKSKSSVTKYEPFSGKFVCEPIEVMTGLELCFQPELKYVAPYCTTLEEGYKLDLDNIKEARSTKDNSAEVKCPAGTSMITMKLKEDEDNNIRVYLTCASIIEA